MKRRIGEENINIYEMVRPKCIISALEKLKDSVIFRECAIIVNGKRFFVNVENFESHESNLMNVDECEGGICYVSAYRLLSSVDRNGKFCVRHSSLHHRQPLERHHSGVAGYRFNLKSVPPPPKHRGHW